MRSNGGQVEVLLRVKQAGKPQFAFLQPEDQLHAYYRWVLDTNPQVSAGHVHLLPHSANGAHREVGRLY